MALAAIPSLSAAAAPAAAKASGSRWSSAAYAAAAPIAAAVTAHPFLLGLADGTLPMDCFLFYLEEDLCYLVRYAETLERFGRRLADRSRRQGRAAEAAAADAADAAQLAQWARDTEAEFNRVAALYEELARRKAPLEPSPAALLYSDYEAVQAAGPSLGCGMAALLPCFWVYGVAGRFIAERMTLEGNPYRGWIEWYATPGFDAETAKAAAVADRLAEEEDDDGRRRMTDIFMRACRMEWLLWDAAWRQAGWPI